MGVNLHRLLCTHEDFQTLIYNTPIPIPIPFPIPVPRNKIDLTILL